MHKLNRNKSCLSVTVTEPIPCWKWSAFPPNKHHQDPLNPCTLEYNPPCINSQHRGGSRKTLLTAHQCHLKPPAIPLLLRWVIEKATHVPPLPLFSTTVLYQNKISVTSIKTFLSSVTLNTVMCLFSSDHSDQVCLPPYHHLNYPEYLDCSTSKDNTWIMLKKKKTFTAVWADNLDYDGLMPQHIKAKPGAGTRYRGHWFKYKHSSLKCSLLSFPADTLLHIALYNHAWLLINQSSPTANKQWCITEYDKGSFINKPSLCDFSVLCPCREPIHRWQFVGTKKKKKAN